MQRQPRVGSLFSGIGGFELPAQWHGAKVIWQSEIEPWACEILKAHFPDAIQLGDIQNIDGVLIPPVDIITFGSPCQDMSVAGKRAGLTGARSGLFMEAVRIIREMRKATNGKYPEFAVWENVPGAFSSNKGHDFQAVLEEITEGEIPMPKSGRWATAGMVRGGTADVSWRVLDAQCWGVPQRRKRVYLVADYRGQRSAEILFKPEGVSRYSTPCSESWEETAADIRTSIKEAVRTILNDQGGSQINVEQTDRSPTLRAQTHGHLPVVVYGICSQNSNSMKSDNPYSGIYEAETIRTLDLNGGNPCCNQGGMAVCVPIYALQGNMIGRRDKNGPKGDGITENTSYTLTATDIHAVAMPIMLESHPNDSRMNIDDSGRVQTLTQRMGTGGGNVPFVMIPVYSIDCRNFVIGDKSATLQAKDNGGYSLNYQNPVLMPIYAIDRAAYNQGKNARFDISIKADDVIQTVVAKGPNAVAIPIFSFYPQIKTESQCFIEDIANTVVNGTDHGFQSGAVVPIITLRERAGCKGGGKGPLLQENKTGTLAVNNDQYVFNPIVVLNERQYALTITENIANTLTSTDFKGTQVVFIQGELNYIVRRLTPSECAKLQGFPADWHEGIVNEKGKMLPDTAAYKGYGNAVATVCAEYPIANIIHALKEVNEK